MFKEIVTINALKASRIRVGRYLWIILEKAGRPDRATLTLGKAHLEETNILSIKAFKILD